MKLALSLVAFFLAFSSPAFSQDAPACLTIEQFKEKIVANVEADLSGADLKHFNDNYVRATKSPAPDTVDHVLVLSKPDAEDFMLVGAKNGCVIGAQPINPDVFRKWNGPALDDGSI